MYWSKTFIPTLREDPQEAESRSHQLLLRAGLVRMLMAGVYSYLPAGLRVLGNIERIIRQEMDGVGASEVLLPVLQPRELWERTGRDEVMGEVMVRFTDRRGRKVCLGPTHEEVITDLLKNHISSYKQLPIILYQIQTKIRDELRPRFGLIRGCEFIMKDAYSFDKDEAGCDEHYQAMFEAYTRIFKRVGLRIVTTEADSGVMGGKVSHEFMVPAPDGEDVVLSCEACGRARTLKEADALRCPDCGTDAQKLQCIEVGHIFKLGTKYSDALNVQFLDAEGRKRPVIMGCYGIGVSRLISAIIEQNNDERGIVWPQAVAPYQAAVIALDALDPVIREKSAGIHDRLSAQGIAVLLDDRDERAGVKFNDAELIGIPLCVVVGKKSLAQNKIELKVRKTQESLLIDEQDLLSEVQRRLDGLRA